MMGGPPVSSDQNAVSCSESQEISCHGSPFFFFLHASDTSGLRIQHLHMYVHVYVYALLHELTFSKNPFIITE